MKKAIAAALMICAIAIAAAQTDGESPNPAPHVSKLAAVPGSSHVTLTWRDHPDHDGSYRVYRAFAPIDAGSFSGAELVGEVLQGRQSFTDDAPGGKPLYYAVVAVSPDGEPFAVFALYRNVTSIPVVLESDDDIIGRSVSVTSIDTEVGQGTVVVTFTADRFGKDLILYRSTSPLLRKEDLLDATLIATVPSGSRRYTDYPVAGISYYYGILDAELLKLARIRFVPGTNSTKKPVMIPIEPGTVGFAQPMSARPRPLPYFLLTTEVASGQALDSPSQFKLPERTALSEEAAEAAGRLLDSIPEVRSRSLEPVILDIDTATNYRGDEYSLALILEDHFAAGDWPTTEAALKNFLRVRRSPQIEIRAHFYLGQVYYFTGEYRQAFLEFLMAEAAYYAEVKPWMDDLFNRF